MRQQSLCWPRASPHEQKAFQFETEAPRQRLGDQFCLVVAAFPEPSGEQRYWHYGIEFTFGIFVADHGFKSRRKPRGQWHDCIVFQQQDGSPECVVVNAKAASAIERV
ncbi:MAG TPA: hypothetical protein VEJ39_00475 [Candidatus Acidoferrales bacterium]|nr:hypothetical protein [Candidatus Acidoferrales bacterium]